MKVGKDPSADHHAVVLTTPYNNAEHTSEIFLINSGSVYRPNIRAERAMCLEKKEKALL